jgi:hypothetical protein
MTVNTPTTAASASSVGNNARPIIMGVLNADLLKPYSYPTKALKKTLKLAGVVLGSTSHPLELLPQVLPV